MREEVRSSSHVYNGIPRDEADELRVEIAALIAAVVSHGFAFGILVAKWEALLEGVLSESGIVLVTSRKVAAVDVVLAARTVGVSCAVEEWT